MAMSNKTGVGLEIFAVILATFFLVLRGYAQLYLRAIFTASDGFIILAYLLFFMIFVGDMYAFKAGQWDVNVSDGDAIQKAKVVIPNEHELRSILKILYVSGPLYFTCIWSIKAALLLFYFALINKGSTYLRKFLWITSGLTLVTFIISFCLLMFSCLPVSRNWALDHSFCSSFDKPYAYWFSVSTHIFTDLCIYTMPFLLLPDLTLTPRRKLGVAAIFAVGFISIAVGVIRVVLVGTEFQQSSVDSLSAIEMATAIMVACSPPLKNLFLRNQRRRRGSIKMTREATEWGTIRLGMAAEDYESAQREQAERESQMQERTVRGSTASGILGANEMLVTVKLDIDDLENGLDGRKVDVNRRSLP